MRAPVVAEIVSMCVAFARVRPATEPCPGSPSARLAEWKPHRAHRPHRAAAQIALMLGGFFVVAAMQKWRLHERIALIAMKRIGLNVVRLLFSTMFVTWFLSMWMCVRAGGERGWEVGAKG